MAPHLPVPALQIIPKHLRCFLNPDLVPVVNDIDHGFLDIEDVEAVMAIPDFGYSEIHPGCIKIKNPEKS